MFTRNDSLNYDAREEYRPLESEDFEMPATWGLDDFEDILPERETLEETVQ